MPAKRGPKKKKSVVRKPRPATTLAEERTYEVVLRTDGARITATGTERGLYPKAVAWNRILSFDPGRQSNVEQDKRSLRATGRKTFLDLARSGHIDPTAAEAFIQAAAQSGRVQVEMEWEQEDFGYAARVFPWEAIIALATKQQREALGGKDLVVVRWLKGNQRRPAATGPAGFAVSAAAEKMGYNVATERAAIEAALLGRLELRDLPAKTLGQLARAIDELKPSIIQYVSSEETFPNRPEGIDDSEGRFDEIAATVARESPQLVAFSTCHSGRRLAPLAIAHGAHLAVGFHGWVADSSCPAFFGTFYRAWQQEAASRWTP